MAASLIAAAVGGPVGAPVGAALGDALPVIGGGPGTLAGNSLNDVSSTLVNCGGPLASGVLPIIWKNLR